MPRRKGASSGLKNPGSTSSKPHTPHPSTSRTSTSTKGTAGKRSSTKDKAGSGKKQCQGACCQPRVKRKKTSGKGSSTEKTSSKSSSHKVDTGKSAPTPSTSGRGQKKSTNRKQSSDEPPAKRSRGLSSSSQLGEGNIKKKTSTTRCPISAKEKTSIPKGNSGAKTSDEFRKKSVLRATMIARRRFVKAKRSSTEGTTKKTTISVGVQCPTPTRQQGPRFEAQDTFGPGASHPSTSWPRSSAGSLLDTHTYASPGSGWSTPGPSTPSSRSSLPRTPDLSSSNPNSPVDRGESSLSPGAEQLFNRIPSPQSGTLESEGNDATMNVEPSLKTVVDPDRNSVQSSGRISPESSPMMATLNSYQMQENCMEENQMQEDANHKHHPRDLMQGSHTQNCQQADRGEDHVKVHHQDHTEDDLPDHNQNDQQQIHREDYRESPVQEDPQPDRTKETSMLENDTQEAKKCPGTCAEPALVAPILPGIKAAACRVTFLHSQELVRLCDKMPRVPGRASMVQSLIWAYGLPQYMVMVPGRQATEEELLGFHSSAYLGILRQAGRAAKDGDLDTDSHLAESFGLSYDCPLQEDVYDCSALVAGATITGAEALVAGECDVAINWFGGWHHAQRENASGFCYINDIVLGILKLRTKFQRVLYVDLDLHHGDGVEDAFSSTPRVMTVSFHKYGPGFFPGTGSCYTNGCGKGRHYAINVPLEDGTQDAEYFTMFRKLMRLVQETYKPEAIVCQCGADGLAGDPMETFNLTPLSLVRCVALLLSWKLPTMLLGGGGYNHVNTAKCWAQLTALAVGKKLPVDIPDHQYYLSYGPDYELTVSEGNRRNCNTRTQLEVLLQRLSRILEQIRT